MGFMKAKARQCDARTRERTEIFSPLRKALDTELSPSTYAPTGGFVQATQLNNTKKKLVHGSDLTFDHISSCSLSNTFATT